MPEPLGNPVNIHVFVDANHAGNVVTRRLHKGILVFVQNSPVLWVSRRQNTVETSTFGSEFVALRNARDVIIALRYKLRMFGVPLEGPAQVYCDNQGVVKKYQHSRICSKQEKMRLTIMRYARLLLQVYWRYTRKICRQTSQICSQRCYLRIGVVTSLVPSYTIFYTCPRFPASLWYRYLLRDNVVGLRSRFM